MDFGGLVVQNFFGIIASVIASVLGWLAIRILRGVRDSTERAEKHAEETASAVSKLDKVSLTGKNTELEAWQHDMALRVEALAEGKSDTLAWQAHYDRRLRALELFAEQLSDFAHGTADVPTFTTTTTKYVLQEETA